MLDAGFKTCAMENFSSMLEVVNGHLREEMYFESLFTWLFKPAEAVWLKPSFRKNVPINRDAATMVFTAGNKDGHDALKRLLERILPAGWLVQVIDGDETTNKEAENLAKACLASLNSVSKRDIFFECSSDRSFGQSESAAISAARSERKA